MDLSKMTARVRHNADGGDTGSGMLTVNVSLEQLSTTDFRVTSHSHSVKEILAAHEAGMQVRVLAQAPFIGTGACLLFPLALVLGNSIDGGQASFGSIVGGCNGNDLGDAEEWSVEITVV